MDVYRKRLFALYLGGVINAYVGLYLLLEGFPLLERPYATGIGIAFIVFAAIDFGLPVFMRAQALRRGRAPR